MIAFICGTIVVVLMVMALASTEWLMADGWRQGLFAHCIAENAPTPLPFNVMDPPDCYASRDVGTYGCFHFRNKRVMDVSGYIRAAAALCIVTLITDIVATLLTGLGLRSNDHRNKYKYYRIAVYVMILSRRFLNYE